MRDRRIAWVPTFAPVQLQVDHAKRFGWDETITGNLQRILDNPFLLLFLGVTVPTVFYVIWGVMEIAQIPIAK